MYERHYREALPPPFARIFEKRGIGDLKIDLWNAFADSGLIGICEDDCSAIPRILPASYFPVIRRTCGDVALFLMRLLSLPAREIKAILPPTPVTDYLIRELGVLKHRPARLTGSLRYDMAIIGKPGPSNPPMLLEVNEIGFDGTGRSSYIQETLLKLFPKLKGMVRCFDTAASEVKNMRRLGRKIVRFQYDCYNWEEEIILLKAKMAGLDIDLVSPADFGVEIDEDCKRLKAAPVTIRDEFLRIGRERCKPDAFQLAYSFELSDYMETPKFFRKLIRSKTPQYSPFITGLIAPKTILILLHDDALRRKLLGARRAARLTQSLLPAAYLSGNEAEVTGHCRNLVIKHADGMGGEKVFVGKKIPDAIQRIKREDRKYWVVQDRIHLNTIDVDGFLSRRRRAIADLGAYIHYDWNGILFTNFSVGGFITRATNRSLKVNVSGGGIQVPVMFDLSR